MVALLLVGATQVALSQAASPPAAPTAPVAPAPQEPAREAAQSALTGGLMYQLLVGELNAQNGEPSSAYAIILDAARRTNDPRLYQRAVDVALQAREGDAALQAARAWRQALPSSREANRYLLQILIGLNRIAETVEPMQRELVAVEPQNRPVAIGAIPRYFARAADKKLAAATVEQALAPYLTSGAEGAAAWTAVGRLRLDAGNSVAALEAARRAQTLDAQADAPALLALSLMGAKVTEAESLVNAYLQGKPLPEIRMVYARILLDAQRYGDSSRQLQLVTQQKPDYAEAWLILGSLELQDHKLDSAEKSLRRFLELGQARPETVAPAGHERALDQAYLALAQVAEQRKDYAQAEAWLGRIQNDEDQLRVNSRRASILARQGRLPEARRLIQDLPDGDTTQARTKLSAEVQLLRENKQYAAAYELMTQAQGRNPEDIDLAYDLAMLAEKLDKLDEMERLLRSVIAARPDYQHAYNALGYSLAERNTRLPEARQLILKALELAPGDPFITDSLGWAEFRSGNGAEALRILEGAYKNKPDADIAAHLGEVLWSMGQRARALQVWREAAALNAENETLQETLKRLRVKL